MSNTRTIDISKIKIGVRHRKDLGDIASLARSIKDVGLLHPIVIHPNATLIAGERRLAACKELGWTRVPVNVVDISEIVRGECAENAIRKDLLPSEIDAIRRVIEPIVARPAHRPSKESKESFLSSEAGQTRDKIGSFAGVSGRTVEKIKTVIEAAEKDPQRFGDLINEMDRTGKVDSAYAKVNRHRKHDKIAENARSALEPANAGPFPLIYADPPWKWGHFGEANQENEKGKGRTPDQHYPTLTYDEIKDFRIAKKLVSEIAHKDAALFMWCTSANIVMALEVMGAWGFTYKAHAMWVKDKTGLGLVFRNKHEVLLYATRGNMPGPQYQPPSVFEYPRGRHSAKPPEIRAEIEKMYPDFDARTRLELFARETIQGWTPYGFESANNVAA